MSEEKKEGKRMESGRFICFCLTPSDPLVTLSTLTNMTKHGEGLESRDRANQETYAGWSLSRKGMRCTQQEPRQR